MTPHLRLDEACFAGTALVVEDHPDTQSALVALLEERGWEVAISSDGDEAVKIARERRPELICLDLHLPNVCGYDVCEQIREDPILVAAIVVMMSARATLDVRANAIEAGADAYLAKPFGLDELLVLVERIRWERRSSLRSDA